MMKNRNHSMWVWNLVSLTAQNRSWMLKKIYNRKKKKMISDPITYITIYYFVRIIFYDLCALWIGSNIEIDTNKYQSERSLSSRFVASFPLFSIIVNTDCTRFSKRVPAYVNILRDVSRLYLSSRQQSNEN